jgi:hypothetical protein
LTYEKIAKRLGCSTTTAWKAAALGVAPDLSRFVSMTPDAIYQRNKRMRQNELAHRPEPLGRVDLRPARADAPGVLCPSSGDGE